MSKITASLKFPGYTEYSLRRQEGGDTNMTYSLVCAEGHEPETLTVEAENDETAMPLVMEKVNTHFTQMHPDMMGMSDKEKGDFIIANWTKA